MIRVVYSGEGDSCYFVVYTFGISNIIELDSLNLYWEELIGCDHVCEDFKGANLHYDDTGFGFDGDQSSAYWSYYVRHGLLLDDRKLGTDETVAELIEFDLWSLWCGTLDVPVNVLHLHRFRFVERRKPNDKYGF